MGAGAGFNALASAGVQAGLDKIQRKRDASDEERRLKAEPIIAGSKQLIANIPAIKEQYGEGSPQHKEALQNLANFQQSFDELYHPVKAPGAIQQDIHWMMNKVHGIAMPKGKTPATTPSQPTSVAVNTPTAPSTSPDLPAYQETTPRLPSQGGNILKQIPGVPSTTLPGMTAAPAPLLVTQSFGNDPVPGMTAKGNADLAKTDNIDNGDGTHSSTFSMSFGTDKGEVLVPGVGDGKTYPKRQLRVLYTLPDGSQKWAVPGNQPHNWIAPERPTPQNNEALNQYHKTGKNFGTFEDEKAADAYGKKLHEDQEKYGNNGVTAHPVTPSGNVTTLPVPPAPNVAKPVAPSWGQAQLLKHKAASMQKAQQEAALLASGAPLSPQQQAMSQFRTQDLVHQAQIESTLKQAEKLGLSETAMDELKQQLVGLKNVTPKPLTGEAGKPFKGADGRYYQGIANPDGTTGTRPMPEGWKPNTKSVRGTLVNTKDHGWIQTWVDPYNPSKIIGYQKVTPGSRYTGTTSSSSSTDPFGLTTSSSRSTTPTSGSAPVDMDLSGMQELPQNFSGGDIPATDAQSPTSASPSAAPSGSPNKTPAPSSAPPSSVARPTTSTPANTPASLRKRVPSPPPASNSPSSGVPPAFKGNKLIEESAQGLTSGKLHPSMVKGKGAAQMAIFSRAMELDPNFDPSKAESDFIYANNKATKDLLNYLDSLTGRDGKSGNLADLVKQSNSIDRTDFPALNDLQGWAKLKSGNKDIVEYYTTITEVADQVAKILQGGGSGGGTSDAKLKQASELFDRGFTKDQIEGVASSLSSLLSNRKGAIIGDNYYLNKWRGSGTSSDSSSSSKKKVSLAKAKGLDRYKGMSDTQITSDLQGKNYEVRP